MDDFNLNSKYKHYRKRRDEYKNTVLEFLVREPSPEKNTYLLDLETHPDDKFDFKKEANRLVKRSAAQGLFSSFSIRDRKNAEIHGKLPQGYQVDFIIPPAVGGAYSIDNLYIVPKEVSLLMYRLYWRQVIPELRAFLNRGEVHHIYAQLPPIPTFFSRQDFLNFVPNYEKQEIKQYLDRKEKWRINSLQHVSVTKNRKIIVLQLQRRKKAPEGMKFVLMKTKAPSMVERAKTRQEYLRQRQDIVRASFVRGDFDHLPSKTKEKILKTGHVPEYADLTCHHVLPRSLGGKNNLDNMCWVSKNDHIRLHRAYIDPLIEYIDGLFDEKREVWVEIPVPESSKMPVFVLSKQGVIVQKKDNKKKNMSLLKKVTHRLKRHKNR